MNQNQLIASLKEQLNLIEQAPPNNKSTKDKIHRTWKDMYRSHPEIITLAYEALINGLDQFEAASANNKAFLYKYLQILSSFMPHYGELQLISKVQGARLLDIIDKLLQLPDFQILETNSIVDRGTLGSFIQYLLEAFYRHTPSTDPNKELAASFVLPLYQRFAPEGSYVLHLLPYHSEPIKTTAALLSFCIENQLDNIAFYHLLSDMISEHARRDDFFHKKAPEICTELLTHKNHWTAAGISFFINKGLLSTLGVNLATKEAQLKAIDERLEWLKAEGKMEGLKHYKAKRKDVEAHYDENQTKQWNGAIRTIAVKKPVMKALQIVSKSFPEHEARTPIQQLLKESLEFKNKPKKFPIPKSPQTKFRDFAFKLWVIEALMYEQALLTPKFDVREFAREYDKRQIDVEQDGYEIIPEVKKYFQNTDIPHELLQEVTHLVIDDGIWGGAEVYNQLWPFYDPGCGDTVLPVTNKAIDDLDLLPNLKKITGLETSNPSKKLLIALEERGIALEAIE